MTWKSFTMFGWSSIFMIRTWKKREINQCQVRFKLWLGLLLGRVSVSLWDWVAFCRWSWSPPPFRLARALPALLSRSYPCLLSSGVDICLSALRLVAISCDWWHRAVVPLRASSGCGCCWCVSACLANPAWKHSKSISLRAYQRLPLFVWFLLHSQFRHSITHTLAYSKLANLHLISFHILSYRNLRTYDAYQLIFKCNYNDFPSALSARSTLLPCLELFSHPLASWQLHAAWFASEWAQHAMSHWQF